MIEIKSEQPHHAKAIENLLDTVFGSGRQMKAVYCLREAVSPLSDLCHVALVDGELHGTIRFWPVIVRDAGNERQCDLLLLGPLAVEPVFQGAGIGRALVEYSLIKARRRGYRAAVLVGDLAYYDRFHFSRSGARGLVLPGEADQERVLLREVVEGAAADCVGTLFPAVHNQVELTAIKQGRRGVSGVVPAPE